MNNYKNISPRLLSKLFKGVVLYSVEKKPNGYFEIKRYILKDNQEDLKGYVYVKLVDESLNVENRFSILKKIDDLYICFLTAKETKIKYNKIISKFDFIPHMRIENVIGHFDELMFIQEDIHKKLKGYEKFLGIDFCNVGANGIQIRGHHRDIKGYTFGN